VLIRSTIEKIIRNFAIVENYRLINYILTVSFTLSVPISPVAKSLAQISTASLYSDNLSSNGLVKPSMI